ncbi:uncharacterized protein B0I36DRAFT_333270 [Microdochium trichocladiopsis]|uniref:Zn(2)-C6 fungal-type domain-containing protein n=1 Tax=Microdochium trichocladiopsis TaxID=1682393 RepID=A0A9P8XYE8_9PEZI|nr:uncharacterized protein B0I36DRAFT_333270 [Microdochium trichocladiopsis]KAH7020843.1 hypothetical protein B0I36DRAFT_333270 [Microdochium trichocladiopsis]
MKRRADNSSAPARRQPQTSCDSCRQKKLKCDREQPCGSCRARGLQCSIASGLSVDHGGSIAEVLARLAALEQTVLLSKTTDPPADPINLSRQSRAIPQPLTPPVLSSRERRGQQTADFFNAAYDGSLRATTSRARRSLCLDIQVVHGHREIVEAGGPRPGPSRIPVSLVSRQGAVAMVHDFVDNAYHSLPIIHIASTLTVVKKVYDMLGSPGGGNAVSPDHVALILAICAACAFFWTGKVPCRHRFESEQIAVQASRVWIASALEVLHGAERLGSVSLEGAQAYALVAHLVYNTEGPSSRFYRLHTASVTACRELGVHQVDNGRGSQPRDDAATREIKRRLWWHVTATDWMLGFNCGRLDGTYTVQPRQMKVALPRNLNDKDLSIDSDVLTYPPGFATQASCLLQVVRLAEISREVIDALNVEDNDTLDRAYNDRVLALDRLFRDAMDGFPAPLKLGAPISGDAPRFLCLQRAGIHLGFHSRRARLHRPFLLLGKEAFGGGGDDDGGSECGSFQTSREVCVSSARTVLDISLDLLEHSLLRRRGGGPPPPPPLDSRRRPRPSSATRLQHPGHEDCPGAPVHRLGIVINHLFWACAILAFDSGGGVRAQPLPPPSQPPREHGAAERLQATAMADGPDHDADDNAEVQDALAYVCRLLAAAAEESTVAAELVRGMKDVLGRFRIRGVGGSRDYAAASGGGGGGEEEEVEEDYKRHGTAGDLLTSTTTTTGPRDSEASTKLAVDTPSAALPNPAEAAAAAAGSWPGMLPDVPFLMDNHAPASDLMMLDSNDGFGLDSFMDSFFSSSYIPDLDWALITAELDMFHG